MSVYTTTIIYQAVFFLDVLTPLYVLFTHIPTLANCFKDSVWLCILCLIFWGNFKLSSQSREI